MIPLSLSQILYYHSLLPPRTKLNRFTNRVASIDSRMGSRDKKPPSKRSLSKPRTVPRIASPCIPSSPDSLLFHSPFLRTRLGKICARTRASVIHTFKFPREPLRRFFNAISTFASVISKDMGRGCRKTSDDEVHVGYTMDTLRI